MENLKKNREKNKNKFRKIHPKSHENFKNNKPSSLVLIKECKGRWSLLNVSNLFEVN